MKSFPLIYSSIFGIISAMAGTLFVKEPHGAGWEYLWISTGTGGFITAYVLSILFFRRRPNPENSDYIVIGLTTGILCHWVHWYISSVAIYINVELLGAYMYGEPINPFIALLTSIPMSFVSLMFFGWTAIPLAIGAIFLTKGIIKLNVAE